MIQISQSRANWHADLIAMPPDKLAAFKESVDRLPQGDERDLLTSEYNKAIITLQENGWDASLIDYGDPRLPTENCKVRVYLSSTTNSEWFYSLSVKGLPATKASHKGYAAAAAAIDAAIRDFPDWYDSAVASFTTDRPPLDMEATVGTIMDIFQLYALRSGPVNAIEHESTVFILTYSGKQEFTAHSFKFVWREPLRHWEYDIQMDGNPYVFYELLDLIEFIHDHEGAAMMYE
jgi:hypothetical protein